MVVGILEQTKNAISKKLITDKERVQVC